MNTVILSIVLTLKQSKHSSSWVRRGGGGGGTGSTNNKLLYTDCKLHNKPFAANKSRNTKPSPREVRPGCTGPRQTIRHFRVSPGLCIKTRLSAQPLIWKRFFTLVQIKLIFKGKVVYLPLF